MKGRGGAAKWTKLASTEELAALQVPPDYIRCRLHSTTMGTAHMYKAVQIVQPMHRALGVTKSADTEEGLK